MVVTIFKSENLSIYPGKGSRLSRLKRALARQSYRTPANFNTRWRMLDIICKRKEKNIWLFIFQALQNGSHYI